MTGGKTYKDVDILNRLHSHCTVASHVSVGSNETIPSLDNDNVISSSTVDGNDSQEEIRNTGNYQECKLMQ